MKEVPVVRWVSEPLNSALSTVGTWGLIPLENSGSQARTHTPVLPQPTREDVEVSMQPLPSVMGKTCSRHLRPNSAACPSLATVTHPEAWGQGHILPKHRRPCLWHSLAQGKETRMQPLHVPVVFAGPLSSHSLGPETSSSPGNCTDDRRIAFHFFLYDLFQVPKIYIFF